jgi:phage baseplate assembly protein W
MNYSDLSFDIDTKHPITGDTPRLINQSAINNSLKNLLLTPFGTVPHDRSKGSNLYKLIGELNTAILKYEVKTEVDFVIKTQEPRVELLDTLVLDDQTGNGIIINVIYRIKSSGQISKLDINLTLNR